MVHRPSFDEQREELAVACTDAKHQNRLAYSKPKRTARIAPPPSESLLFRLPPFDLKFLMVFPICTIFDFNTVSTTGRTRLAYNPTCR
jgi:hypothetical protein